MFKNACRSLSALFILFFGFINISFASTQKSLSLADIAGTLINGTDFITRFMLAATVILGVGFIIFSFSTYRQHRMTPKLVPLDRPILYCIMGIALCCLPFVGPLFGIKTFSTLDLKKQKSVVTSKSNSGHYLDMDAPIEYLDPLEVAEKPR